MTPKQKLIAILNTALYNLLNSVPVAWLCGDTTNKPHSNYH